MSNRTAEVTRNTSETQITVKLNLDGTGKTNQNNTVLDHATAHREPVCRPLFVRGNQSFLDGDDIPTTPPPQVEQRGDYLVVQSPPGSSSAYQVHDSQHWQLYQAPIPLTPLILGKKNGEELRIKVKSVRYGWQSSSVVEFSLEQ